MTPHAPRERAERSRTLRIECGDPIEPSRFDEIARAMALHHHKWDAQVGDTHVLAPFPLLIRAEDWNELASIARKLASETVAVEREIATRPELFEPLGIPAPLTRLLAVPGTTMTPSASRIMRFDFHPTEAGWRISEVNSDVPGGFTEASEFPALVARETAGGHVLGDPASKWATGLTRGLDAGGSVAILTAPGWPQDAQVAAHLASVLRARLDLGRAKAHADETAA